MDEPSAESQPLAVAVNEAAASLVSGMGTEHKDRTGQGISSLPKARQNIQ